jgi:hypothetical protein
MADRHSSGSSSRRTRASDNSIGQFIIGSEIGKGSFAQVYIGKHKVRDPHSILGFARFCPLHDLLGAPYAPQSAALSSSLCMAHCQLFIVARILSHERSLIIIIADFGCCRSCQIR